MLMLPYRNVKSILKNAPKRHEREDTQDMMEVDPLELEEEGGEFLKKLWGCVGEGVKHENSVYQRS